MGKEEIACYEQFLLFPQCFQKQSVADALKSVSMQLRVNPLSNKLLSLSVCLTGLLKTLQEEIARDKQFLLFPQCFLPF